MQRVLTHAEGGLKNIPPHARRMLLLTQADTPELQAHGSAIAENLMAYFDSVVTSQGEPQNQEATSIYNLEALHMHEETAGIVLAAGGATRFGQSKQLLDWGGKPFVRQVAETALGSRLSPVIVVVGAFAQEVKKAVAGLAVQIVENPDWEAGHASSIGRGVRALPEKTGAAVFLLSDQPQIPSQLIQSLVGMHGQSLGKIIAPLIDERRGNPVLFDRDTFGDLASLSGDQGGRALFARYKVQWLPWHDANLLLDVDTPEDYRRLLEAYRPGAA
jgi:molybdenum cofactor cytidylyltransferase